MDRIAQGYEQPLREIHAEKAAALARIAGTLEALIADLGVLQGQLAEADPEERRRLVERHGRVREQALLYRWYLEVQREAIGLSRHEALDALYPIPAPIRD